MKTPNITQRFRTFFGERKFSLHWLAHFSLVELLIVCIVLLPSVATNAAFTAPNGDYDIWVDGGRVPHWFAIHEANSQVSPNHFAGATLWIPGQTPGGGRIQGNFPAAPNGMVIRDMRTNEVAPLSDDGNGSIVVPATAWAPADGSAIRTVYFTLDTTRSGHSIAVMQGGTTTLATIADFSDTIWGGMSDGGSWESMTGSGFATFDPAQSFRVVDLTTQEQCGENVTNTAFATWEPLVLPPPVQQVTLYLDAAEIGNNFILHAQAANGNEMQQTVSATETMLYGFYTYDWGWFPPGNTPETRAMITASVGEGMSFWLTRDADGVDPQTVNSNRFFLDPLYVVESRPMCWQLFGAFSPLPLVQMSFYLATSYESEWWYGYGVYAVQNGAACQLQPVGNVLSIPDWDYSGNDHTFYYREYTANVVPGRSVWVGYSTSYFGMGNTQNPMQHSWTWLSSNADQTWLTNGWTQINGTQPPQGGTDAIRVILPESRGEDYHLFRGDPFAGDTNAQDRGAFSFTTLQGSLLNSWTNTYRDVNNRQSDGSYSYGATDPQGWFLIESGNTSPEVIALHPGENDLRTWYHHEEVQPLQISSSRRSHTLSVRCEDGTEFPVTWGNLDGNISESGSGSEFNSYYYYHASSAAKPGLTWFVWDETMQEAAPMNTAWLVNWIGIRPPEPFTGWLQYANRNQSIRAKLQWQADPYEAAAFEIERAVVTGSYAGPWQGIVTIPDASIRSYDDTSIVAGGVYNYRIRGTFGPAHSEWSTIASVAVPSVIDSDGDGIPDDQEIIDGTDPFDPNSRRGAIPIPESGTPYLKVGILTYP